MYVMAFLLFFLPTSRHFVGTCSCDMTTMGDHQEDELLDYEEEDAEHEQAGNGAEAAGDKKAVKGSYVSIHSSGFRDFLLKPELLRAIVDCGFEHPSEGELGNGKSLQKEIGRF